MVMNTIPLKEQKKQFESEVRCLFESPEIKAIEIEILNLYYQINNKWELRERNAFAIQRLLCLRKSFLDKKFAMNDYNKSLLTDFNMSMKEHLIIMRERSIEIYNKTKSSSYTDEIEVEGKCFLGYTYPRTHPVQTIRSKKMWQVLNGALDDFMSTYDSGVASSFHLCSRDRENSKDFANQLLYLGEEDNWNEGLDSSQTNDMHLIYAFHNLWSHLQFSIYDLLWVRDFNIEICSNTSYSTSVDEDDDLDWDKYDFTD